MSVTSLGRKERRGHRFPRHEQHSRRFRFARAAWIFGGPPPDPAVALLLRLRSATDLSSYAEPYEITERAGSLMTEKSGSKKKIVFLVVLVVLSALFIAGYI